MNEKARGPPALAPSPEAKCTGHDRPEHDGRDVIYRKEEMTENATEQKLCIVGGSTESPCPFPATHALPHRLPEGKDMCAYHAATEPLVEESDELGVCLELVRAYLKGARRQAQAGPLVEVLERAEADFSERRALASGVLEDLREAERALMRGRPN